jgi:hypothetical protein
VILHIPGTEQHSARDGLSVWAMHPSRVSKRSMTERVQTKGTYTFSFEEQHFRREEVKVPSSPGQRFRGLHGDPLECQLSTESHLFPDDAQLADSHLCT